MSRGILPRGKARIPSSRPVNRGVIVAIVVLVIVIILIVAALSFHPPSPPSLPGTNAVTVTGMYAHSPDDACGLNGVNEPGFTANAFAWAPVGWVIPASESVSLPCTVTNITTNTSGFEIAAILPVTGTSQMTILSFAVFTPASYNGPPDVTFT